MILIMCPHCSQLIEIVELNCCIFRCGIYQHNGEQIPPHLPKIECDRLVENRSIYGCGKPFLKVYKTRILMGNRENKI